MKIKIIKSKKYLRIEKILKKLMKNLSKKLKKYTSKFLKIDNKEGFKMKKVKNDSQPYVLYIFAIMFLPFAAFFVGFCFYLSLLVFDGINFWSIYGILLPIIFFYLIMRAIKNGILYFIPREECYIEDNNLIYKRILFSKFTLKKIKISILDIQDIIDRGAYKKITTSGNYLNPLNYITTFF